MTRTMEEILLDIMEEEANIDTEIDQELYPKPEWAVNQIVRASGLVENICTHGVGHPHENYLKRYDADGSKGLAIHGCDLCCVDEETRKRIKKKIEKHYD